MKPSRVLLGTFLAMIVTQTIGSIDGQHRLPAPRKFVAISTAWGIMFLMADLGFGKLAARLSMLILLTGMVVGPFGATAIGFLNNVSSHFSNAPEGEPGVGGVPGIPGVNANPKARVS